MTLLGLGVGGLIFLLCTFFFLGANSSSSSGSRLLRYFLMLLLIYLNSNSIASISFSSSITKFIAWDFVWAGGDFALASGFPVANLFCNTWLKS